MKAPRTAFWIYLVGVALLGVVLGMAQEQLRAMLGDWLAFAALMAYLVLLRIGAEYLERRRA